MTLKRALLATLAALPLLLMTACNTVEGIGEDMSATGEAISDVADDAKP